MPMSTLPTHQAWLLIRECGQGTGTKAGDPVEVKAIHDTIGVARQDDSYETPLLVGSVKPNVSRVCRTRMSLPLTLTLS